jgi:hypothetical protein
MIPTDWLSLDKIMPNQCGGFGIRFSIAATFQIECQIQNHQNPIFSNVPFVLTFVNEPAAK